MPLDLPPTKAYSTASIGKAYLDAMGIRPPRLRPEPSLGLSAEAVSGAAMQGYFGGRTECRIRRLPVPVAYLDFLSQYPTVNALMGLWRYLTARELQVVDTTDEVGTFLNDVTLDSLFRPETWNRLPALVQVIADGDVLPVRGRWNFTEQSWQIGVNPLTSSQPLWYTLPDVAASKLMTGRTPKVVRALRLTPLGRQRLRPVKLRGEVPIDPRRQDFFRVVIEERARAKERMKTESESVRRELDRLQLFLKILANSASYGILAEMNQQEDPGDCTIWTGDAEPFACTVRHPEELGRFCCPPLAAIITGAGRLLLAVLERCLTDLGGSYAMSDTDSMAVVATEHGELVMCPGGPHRTEEGREAIRALSRRQVDDIVQRFADLNPYDREAVPESVLKVEDENFDPETRERRELWCYAISSKRYCLYNLNGAVERVMRKWSEHGLGHLLNPTAPESNDRDWMRQVWDELVRDAQHRLTVPPIWHGRMAASRITVSNWDMYQQFQTLGESGNYSHRVKPGNFLLIAQADTYMRTAGEKPIPIAPYESDPQRWDRLPWLDRKSGDRIGITTDDREVGPGVVRARTYADVLAAHRSHPEAKSLSPDGSVCGHKTIGMLSRRPVIAASISHVGKETNRLEEVLAGEEDDYNEVYAEYERPGATLDVLRRVLRPFPRHVVADEAGISTRRLADIVEGRAEPHPATAIVLERIARRRLLDDLRRLEIQEPGTGLLPLPALAGICDGALEDARWELGGTLRTLRAHAGVQNAAAFCALPRSTFERRLDSIERCDIDTLLTLNAALEPYREALDELAAIDAEASNLEAEIGALHETIAADPHRKHLPWLDRTHIRYDRSAWQRGRLLPVRSPVRRGPGGWYRVETVAYSDILDREAQQMAADVVSFMRTLEALRQRYVNLAALENQREALRLRATAALNKLRLSGFVVGSV